VELVVLQAQAHQVILGTVEFLDFQGRTALRVQADLVAFQASQDKTERAVPVGSVGFLDILDIAAYQGSVDSQAYQDFLVYLGFLASLDTLVIVENQDIADIVV
jgi:hypothetical protein